MDWGRERILIVDVRRETFHSIGNGRLWGSLAWSPDGRFIAAVGQEGKGELNAGDDVYLIRVEGGRPRNITRMKRPRVDRRTFCNRSVFAGGGLLTHLTWSRDGKNLAMLSSYRHIPEGADAFDIVTFNVGSGTWETAFRSPRDRCTKDGFGKPFIRKPPRHVELLGWI
jgi:Tol biopolymer transport system component